MGLEVAVDGVVEAGDTFEFGVEVALRPKLALAKLALAKLALPSADTTFGRLSPGSGEREQAKSGRRVAIFVGPRRMFRPGQGQVATPGRAVGVEAAPIAKRSRLGPEVLDAARPLDRGPDSGGLALQPGDRLVRGGAANSQRLTQVEQLDLCGAPAETCSHKKA